jgi:hypothetical protein
MLALDDLVVLGIFLVGATAFFVVFWIRVYF